MKIIRISNGEIRLGHEFVDLPRPIQEKVLQNQIEFEIEAMNEDSPYFDCVTRMEKMQTPWFLGAEIYSGHKIDLIESIEANDYLFDEEGNMLPVRYHTKGNKIVKTTYGKKELKCTIKNK